MPKQIPIEDWFDLHSFFSNDVPSVLNEYIEQARKLGLREVRVVHGKGKGVRRSQVRQLLAASPLVSDFFDAPPERGSLGATIVILKP